MDAKGRYSDNLVVCLNVLVRFSDVYPL
jgi:hypothetical protein